MKIRKKRNKKGREKIKVFKEKQMKRKKRIKGNSVRKEYEEKE